MKTLSHSHLAQIYVSQLRDRCTQTSDFYTIAQRLATLLAAQTCETIPLQAHTVETPLNVSCEGAKLSHGIVLIPILRAGLSLLESFQHVLPNAKVGFAGVGRNKISHMPEFYSWTVPEIKDKVVIVLDPMLATGNSAQIVLDKIYALQPHKVYFVGVIAATAGLALLEKRYPDLEINVAAVDAHLNEQKYIVPGLGDYGDRLYGTL